VTSRLRRVLLINAKTSGTECSGAIAEIDPRDGSAIIGKNGVGKTTTLQLIPLFLGSSPNHIAQSGGTREHMLRFVLPQPQCAVVFEYQRGDTENDIRLSILRRQDGNDAPEYRFIEGPFRKELFIELLADGSGAVFLNDLGTVDAATNLGLAISAKISASEYRRIILNIPSPNKDADKERMAARKYSFSHKKLPHLDRLVSSVVKEKVDFRDFTAVAVTMVLDQMGGFIGSSNASQKLSVRQGKEQIERWLKNRDACERSMKAKDDVESLRTMLDRHRERVIAMRELRADVQRLSRLMTESKEARSIELSGMTTEYMKKSRELEESILALRLRSGELDESFRKASDAHRHELSSKHYYDDQEARRWSLEVGRLPLLRDQKGQTESQMTALKGVAEGIGRKFDIEIEGVKRRAAESKSKMEEGKSKYDDQYQGEIKSILEQEVASTDALRDKHAFILEALQTSLNDLNMIIGELKAEVNNPSISLAYIKNQEEAQAELNSHNAELLKVQTKYSTDQADLNAAKGEFDRCELMMVNQKQIITNAQLALESAKLTSAPPAGSLHAALMNAADDAWKTNLARVLNRDLLLNKDLSPALLEETANTLYGWNIDLGSLEIPDWTNDDLVKAMIADCAENLVTAQSRLRLAQEAFQESSTWFTRANAVFEESKANQNVLQSKTFDLMMRVSDCTDAMKAAKIDAVADFRKKLDTVLGQQSSEKLNLQRFRDAQLKEANELVTEFRIAREQALARRNGAYATVDGQVRTYMGEQAARVKQIEGERDNELRGAGVDVDKLGGLRVELSALSRQIEEISNKEPLVDAWQKWINSNGPARLEGLEVEATRLESEKLSAAKAVREESTAIERAQSAYDIKKRTISGALSKLESEIENLKRTDAALWEFSPAYGSKVTDITLAAELQGQYSGLRTEFDRLVIDIEAKYKRLDQTLTAQESAVKDFITLCLEDLGVEASRVERANRLTQAYDRIGREVVGPVNAELSTILSHISQFRKQIQRFETEVKSFNNRLQAGLDGVVVGFDRLKDFKIAVVTDFAKIDFMDKLKSLDDVVRSHREQPRATYTLEVPSASSAYVLQDFMSVLSNGALEIDLGQHITLSGSVNDEGNVKTFNRESELESLSSTGITAIALITLLSGMLNVIRGTDPIYIPWVTDEVGRFDADNFSHLMSMLKENKIDVVTASPALTPASYEFFAHRYLFGKKGSIAIYKNLKRPKRILGQVAMEMEVEP
jgi:Protein of unknown function (DUF3584)